MANRVSVEITAQTTGFKQGLSEASEAAEKYETDMRKISDYTVSFNRKLSAAKKEVKDLAVSYAMLDKAAKNSDFGKRMKAQLEAAKKEAAEYIDMQGDIQRELKEMSSDTGTLDTLTDSLGAIGDVASLTASSIALFTGKSEDAERAVVIFTTAQSGLATATKIVNALQLEGNVMRAVTATQSKVAAAAIALQTKTTVGATVAQAAFNAVAKANPYILLATVIIALVTAIGTYIAVAGDAAEAEEELEKKAEEAAKAAKESRDAYIGAAAQYQATASRITHLQQAYKTTNSELEKTAILKEAQSEFKKLGLECNSVTDAQRILVQNGQQVSEMLRVQGDIAAITAMRMEAYKKSLSGLLERGEYDTLAASLLAGNNKDVVEFDKVLDHLQGKLVGLQKGLKFASDSGRTTGRGGSGGGSAEIKAERDSIAALQDEYNKYRELVEKGKIKAPRFGKTFLEDFEHYEKLIKDKKIEIGIEEIDPKDIPGTEAWYKEKIAKLEQAKAKLPIDAYVERDDLQAQIDDLNAHLKVDVVVQAKDISKEISGNFEPTIKNYENAISVLQNQLNELDWSKMGENGSKTFEEYTQKILEYKAALEKLNQTMDEALLTPQQKARKEYEKWKEKQDLLIESTKSVGTALDAAGNAFKSVGDQATAAALSVAASVTDMVAQVVPQILKLIGVKEGEAMSTGIAEATKIGFPQNIPAIASIVTVLLSTFAQIAGIVNGGKFAEGGIVGGSSYSGDRVHAMLNSGEMVFNKRQQQNLFDIINKGLIPANNGTSNINVHGVIRGTDILLVQKNTNKSLSKAGSSINIG